MTRLTKEEKETIILTSMGDDKWTVYTFDPALKRKLKAFAEKYPECCSSEERKDYDPDAVSYVIDKQRMSLRFTAPYSLERRKAARARIESHRFGKVQSNVYADEG